MKVLTGISGGVDSAVAAFILKEQGYEVIGAMMKVYSGDAKNIVANSCYGSDKTKEIEDAKANCKVVGCDFYIADVSKEFDSLVFAKFKQEYLSARTPNPCVLCNPSIKFGVFPDKIRQMGIGFDKFATGHYARNEFNENIAKFQLKRGKNAKKDQSYFLYALTQEKLKNILFPLGSMQKEDVRKYALEKNIPVAKKQDSQDFYGGSYGELFDDIDVKCGEIVDKFGNILGSHKGLHNYTIGQRKGLLIAYSEPLYVIGFDTLNNRLIVATKDDTYSSGLYADNLNWIFLDKFDKKIDAQVKIRSAQQPVECTIEPVPDGVKVLFKTPQSAVAPGQAAVFYDDEVVLGGGIIKESVQ